MNKEEKAPLHWFLIVQERALCGLCNYLFRFLLKSYEFKQWIQVTDHIFLGQERYFKLIFVSFILSKSRTHQQIYGRIQYVPRKCLIVFFSSKKTLHPNRRGTIRTHCFVISSKRVFLHTPAKSEHESLELISKKADLAGSLRLQRTILHLKQCSIHPHCALRNKMPPQTLPKRDKKSVICGAHTHTHTQISCH